MIPSSCSGSVHSSPKPTVPEKSSSESRSPRLTTAVSNDGIGVGVPSGRSSVDGGRRCRHRWPPRRRWPTSSPPQRRRARRRHDHGAPTSTSRLTAHPLPTRESRDAAMPPSPNTSSSSGYWSYTFWHTFDAASISSGSIGGGAHRPHPPRTPRRGRRCRRRPAAISGSSTPWSFMHWLELEPGVLHRRLLLGREVELRRGVLEVAAAGLVGGLDLLDVDRRWRRLLAMRRRRRHRRRVAVGVRRCRRTPPAGRRRRRSSRRRRDSPRPLRAFRRRGPPCTVWNSSIASSMSSGASSAAPSASARRRSSASVAVPGVVPSDATPSPPPSPDPHATSDIPIAARTIMLRFLIVSPSFRSFDCSSERTMRPRRLRVR